MAHKPLEYLIKIALFAALLCVSAMIYIPFTVPITLQTLVLFVSLFVLGGRGSAIATLLYIAVGAVGVPVFSGFSGGVSRLFDATGGYIFGMLLGAVVYALMELIPTFRFQRLTSAIASLAVIYITGTLWYAIAYAGTDSVGAILLTCVIPFIIPDIVKLTVAYNIAKRIPRQRV